MNQSPNSQNNSRNDQSNHRSSRTKRVFDPKELRDFLANLQVGIRPVLKVNGLQHPTAILTVDFGSPISPIRLSQDQTQELTSLLRKATRDLHGGEANVRISSDNQNGVFWSSIS